MKNQYNKTYINDFYESRFPAETSIFLGLLDVDKNTTNKMYIENSTLKGGMFYYENLIYFAHVAPTRFAWIKGLFVLQVSINNLFITFA